MLAPFFNMDPTLPYTYIALLSKEALVELLRADPVKITYLIPLEAILACLRYYIKKEGYFFVSLG